MSKENRENILNKGAFRAVAHDGKLMIEPQGGNVYVNVDWSDVEDFKDFVNKYAYDALRETRGHTERPSFALKQHRLGKYSKLLEFLGVVSFSLVSAFFAGAFLDGDWYMALFLGVFIVVYYYLADLLMDLLSESSAQKKMGMFDPKLFGVLGVAVVLLVAVTFLTNIIFTYTVDYCEEEGMFYSEMRCSIEEASKSIRESYGSYYDDYWDNNY